MYEADARSRLRRAGLRVTGPRLAILEHLEHDRTHPTPEAIHAALAPAHPSLSVSTVYNTLEAFLRTGLCRRVQGSNGRLRVDGTVRDHDHAVCRGCGRIYDVERSRPPRVEAPRLPPGVALMAFRIEYEVLCEACRSPQGEGEQAGAPDRS